MRNKVAEAADDENRWKHRQPRQRRTNKIKVHNARIHTCVDAHMYIFVHASYLIFLPVCDMVPKNGRQKKSRSRGESEEVMILLLSRCKQTLVVFNCCHLRNAKRTSKVNFKYKISFLSNLFGTSLCSLSSFTFKVKHYNDSVTC